MVTREGEKIMNAASPLLQATPGLATSNRAACPTRFDDFYGIFYPAESAAIGSALPLIDSYYGRKDNRILSRLGKLMHLKESIGKEQRRQWLVFP